MPMPDASSSVPLNVQDIIDEAAKIQGQMVGDLTKDLAAQRAISAALKNRVNELQNECDMRDDLVRELQQRIEDLENPPITDLEHAELVLDKIIEEEAAKPSNGSKPPAKAV